LANVNSSDLIKKSGRKMSNCWQPYLTSTTGDMSLWAWDLEVGSEQENSQWEVLFNY
jgi:transglutaminase/protease-like cytokinesis protein 3